MNGAELVTRKELDRLLNDKARLVFLTKQTHDANPDASFGRFMIRIYNRLAIEIMVRRQKLVRHVVDSQRYQHVGMGANVERNQS